MDKLTDMIEYLLPLYIEEGKYSHDRHRLHRRPAPPPSPWPRRLPGISALGVPTVSINRDINK